MSDSMLCVEICEAKPNKLFTEEERLWIRFLLYNKKVRCAECGKMAKVHWTMLCQFRAVTIPLDSFVMREPEHSHPPLTPVCQDHPLSPAFTKAKGQTP